MKRWMKMAALVLFVGVSVSACSNDGSQNGGDATNTGVQTKEERQVEIAEMEKEILGLNQGNKNDILTKKAELLLMRYRDYISMNPRDSLTSEYLFKAADLSLGVGKPQASIRYLDRLIQDFPNFRKAPEMMLFRGFIYETYLNEHGNAVKAYQAMIERYPNHRLTNDARASIDNLSLSEEELIEKFKRQNQEQKKNPS
jgi:TolA-binding protein